MLTWYANVAKRATYQHENHHSKTSKLTRGSHVDPTWTPRGPRGPKFEIANSMDLQDRSLASLIEVSGGN